MTAGNKRIRIDQALVDRGLVESRTRAQALILANLVRVDGEPVVKAGQLISAASTVSIVERDHPWVSRGGMKLAHALDRFALDVTGTCALDIGASTGGFTHVLLTRGAKRVFAVDVGHGQLAWPIRQDPRVEVLERTNARHLTRAQIPEPVDIVVCDASFIGLRTVLPASLGLTRDAAHLVALIKPQFEVGRELVGKGGVVRDPALHKQVCDTIAAWLETEMGWSVIDIEPSPILGPEGNREFLIAAHRSGPG